MSTEPAEPTGTVEPAAPIGPAERPSPTGPSGPTGRTDAAGSTARDERRGLAPLRRWRQAYSDDDGPASAVTIFVVGAATLALGLVNLWSDAVWRGPTGDLAAAWHLIPLAIGCAGVAVRRWRPTLGLTVSVAAFLGDAVIGGSLATVLVLFDAIYAVERQGSPRARHVVRTGVGLLIAATAIASLIGALSLRMVLLNTVQTATLLVLPIWWAANVRQKAELAEAAEARADLEAARARAESDRAHAAERAAGAERQAAVRAERARMARELHDAVAGDVAAVVIRAGAALESSARTDTGSATRPDLTAIRDSGLHALAELRTMIEVLQRDDGAEPVAPTLTVDGADLLVRCDTEVHGALPTSLPEAVDRAGFRILREALTNAAHHGDGTPAIVRVEHDARGLTLEVTNTAGVAAPSSSGPGTGLGVVSMTERAEALGGRVEAGPVSTAVRTGPASYRVRAWLPTDARRAVEASR